MVAMAVLGVTILPMLLLREESYHRAILTKQIRVVQELSRLKLTEIALGVRSGEGAGPFEHWPDIRFEYKVTLYDFGAGIEEDEYGDDASAFNLNTEPNDSIYLDDDEKSYGAMVMRHVELRLFYFSLDEEGDSTEREYVVDTYIPLLLTEEQFERSQTESSLNSEEV